MKNYLLIHGAWGTASEFDDVISSLIMRGHRAKAIDLPGHGQNKANLSSVTMNSYVQTVVDVINKQNEKVVLVGHSLAGFVISHVTEIIPEKIERLIYVAAMLPQNGDSPMSLMQSDPLGELLPNIVFSGDQSAAMLTPELIRSVFLHDVKDESLIEQLIPEFMFEQSTLPFMAEATLTEENFGSVAKYYVKATIDKILTPNLQDIMIKNWPVKQVAILPAGHFPLLSMPESLVDAITELSA